jgi:hypothetical protein
VNKLQKRRDCEADPDPREKRPADPLTRMPELRCQYAGQQAHARVQNGVQVGIVFAQIANSATLVNPKATN